MGDIVGLGAKLPPPVRIGSTFIRREKWRKEKQNEIRHFGEVDGSEREREERERAKGCGNTRSARRTNFGLDDKG